MATYTSEVFEKPQGKIMLKEILQKLKIPKIKYKVVRKRLLKEKPLEMTNVDALQILEDFSPNPKQSCIAPKTLKDKYDLEIIVPAYNTEKYLVQCIEALLSQETSYSYHIIFIDDGSTDSTGIILNGYAKHNKVKVIHQKNKGLSGARNTGIEVSCGKYLMFVDSDDYIPKNAVQALLSCAFQHNAQIVEGAHFLMTSKGTVYRKISHKEGCIREQSQMKGYAWGKVIRKDFFEQLSFPLNYLYEDSIMSQILYPIAISHSLVYGIDSPVYYYRRNPQGITRGGTLKKRTIESFWITQQLYEDRKHFTLAVDQAYYEYILSMVRLTYKRTEKMPVNIKQAIFVAFASFIEKEFQGFSFQTNSHTKQDLEYALKHRNYALYEAFCKNL